MAQSMCDLLCILVLTNHIKSRALWSMCNPVLGRQADHWSSLGSSRTKLQIRLKGPNLCFWPLHIHTPHLCTYRHFSTPDERLKTWIKISLLYSVPKTCTFHKKKKKSLLRVSRVILLLCLSRTLIKRTKYKAEEIHTWLATVVTHEVFPIRTLLRR